MAGVPFSLDSNMTTSLTPPVALREPHPIVLHGDTLADDYFWLQDRDRPEVRAYLEAENAYTEAVLEPFKAVEANLYDEMLARIKQTDLSVPYRDAGYWYWSRTEEGKQYPTYCRRRDAAGAPDEILLDLNEMAVGHPYLGVGLMQVSPDGRKLCYSTDVTGGREYTLFIKDLDTGGMLTEPVPLAGSAVWAADSRTILYTVEDQTKRDYRVYRMALGEPTVLVYEETDERFRVMVTRTRSRRFLLLFSASHTTTEAQILEAATPAGSWRVVAPRIQNLEYDLDHHGDRFFIRTNDRGKNFRVVTAPVVDPAPANWIEVLPLRDDVVIEGVECFAGHWVAWERHDGLARIRVAEATTDQVRYVEFPEVVYDAGPGMNAEWDSHQLRYRYESFVTASSVYDFDMVDGTSALLKRKDVLGDYDPARYQSERVFAKAADGTRIPVSLVWRTDQMAAGPRPTYLTGYGSYGIPYPVSFTSNRLSLLDRGVVFAVAHIRGGGEMGRPWHDAGKMAAKMNTFTDFISAADHLVAIGKTDRSRLVIEGGSAGGLLIGAVLNLRPEVCGAAVLQVPFVDVINTMLDASLPLTVGEYEEWGNPAVLAEYRWIRPYCPYTNLAAQAYPAILVRTSLNDSQVMYWEPAKYVARLRTLKTDSNPLLLHTNLGAGHSGASGRYDRLREIATDYVFVLWRMGLLATRHQ